jgi:tyrosyl-tRNA synthetase
MPERLSFSASRGSARRLISQGGGYVNGQRIKTFDQIINKSHLENNSLLLRAGKKKYMRLTLTD